MPAITTAPGPPPMYAIGASASLSPCAGPRGICWRTCRTAFPMIQRGLTTPRSQTSSSMGGRRNRASSGCRRCSRLWLVERGQLHVGEADRVNEAILPATNTRNDLVAQQVFAKECHAVTPFDSHPPTLRAAVHKPVWRERFTNLHRTPYPRQRVYIVIGFCNEVERMERQVQEGLHLGQQSRDCRDDQILRAFDIDLQQRMTGHPDLAQDSVRITQLDHCLGNAVDECAAFDCAEDAGS